MSTTEALADMKRNALEQLRLDIELLDDEETYDDLSFTYGFHMGRLATLRDLCVMTDDEYNEAIGSLAAAVDAEREARGE